MEMYARLSMLEGLLNKSQGSFSNSASARKLQESKELMTASQWGSEKEYDQFFDPRSKVDFVKAVEWGVKNGISKAPHWFGFGQLGEVEDLTQGLNAGITLGNQAPAKGGNIYRRTGLTHRNKSRIGIGGLIKALKNNANNAVTSLIRQRNPDVRGDAQVGDAEDAPSLFDLMEGGMDSRPMKDLLSGATPILKRRLTESQFRLWNVILADPDLITNDGKRIEATKAAKVYQRIYGEPIANTTVARTWARALPIVLEELEDELVTWATATGRRAAAKKAMASRVASRFLEACGDEPCATCEGCGCGGSCDGSCGGNEEAMMEKTSPAPGAT